MAHHVSHVNPGSSVISDKWHAYHILSVLEYDHHPVNHSRWYVKPHSGVHTQHIERAWRTYTEQNRRLRRNRTKSMLSDHLTVIEWYEWLARKHCDGPFGKLIHGISKMSK